jgi:hypothetical protein
MWSPTPVLGASSWSGNAPLVTTRQLQSTIANLNVSTSITSTFSTFTVSSIFSNSLSTNLLTANILSFASLSTNSVSTNFLRANTASIPALTSDSLTASTATISSLSTTSLSSNVIYTPSLNANTGTINSLSLNALDMNNSFITEFRGATSNYLSTMTFTSGNRLELNANSGIDVINDLGANVGYNSEVNIAARYGAGTRVNITADEASVFSPTPSAQVNILAKGNESAISGLSFGGKVNITAEAGSGTNVGLGFGAIDLTANSQGTSPGTIKLSAGSNLIYSGPTSPFVGIYGQNFIYGSLGNAMVSGTPPTLPTLVGTNYFYGALGAGGHTLAIVANRFQGGIGVDFLQPFPLSDLYIQGSLNGTDLIVIKSVRSMAMANSGPITGVGNLGVSSINNNRVFVGIPSSFSNVSITTSAMTVSSVNGGAYPPSIPADITFNTVATQGLTTSSINGAAVFTGIPASFQNTAIITSSLTTSSINGQAVFTGIPSSIATSSITAGTINASSFGTSTITAGNLTATSISCITNLTVSSINGLAPGGGGSTGIPSTISTLAIITSSLRASTITSAFISSNNLFTSSLTNPISFSNIIYPGLGQGIGNDASTILIETPIFLTRFNGLNLSNNKDYNTGTYSSTNTNQTNAWSNSIQSLGGDSQLTATLSTVRLYGQAGILLDGGDVRMNANNLNMANGNIYSTNSINTGNINISSINGASPSSIGAGIPAVLSTQAILTSSVVASTITLSNTINTPFVSTTTVSTLRVISRDVFCQDITLLGDILGGIGSDIINTQGSVATGNLAARSTTTSTLNGFTVNLSCLPSGVQNIIRLFNVNLANAQALNIVCGTAGANLPSGTYICQAYCSSNTERGIQASFGWSQGFQVITPFQTINNLGNGPNKVVLEDNGPTGFRLVNYTNGGGDTYQVNVYFVAGRSNDSRTNTSSIGEFISAVSSPTIYDMPVLPGCSTITGSTINILTNNDISIQAGPYSTPTFLGGGSVAIEATSQMLIAGAFSATILSAGPVLVGSEDEVAIFASTNIAMYSPNIGLVAESTIALVAPEVYISTNCNSIFVQNVRQPFIQYGEVSTTGGSGSVTVTLPVPYSSINAYQAFIAMADSNTAQTSITRDTVSTITLYWSNGGGGSHGLSWNTMGNLECGGGGAPPSGGAAYDLVNYIGFSDTLYGTWVNYGTPDYNVVYIEQSFNGTDGWTNYGSQTIYTYQEILEYSLSQGYYYRFYVVAYYSGTTYNSAYSNAEYVYPVA